MADITFDRPEQHGPLARFFTQYWRVMAAVAVALVAAAGGYAWYSASAQQSKAKAENELGAIIAGKTGPERLAALESYLASAPSSTKGAALLEIARTAQEQKAYDKAAKAWNELAVAGPDGMREMAVMGQATALALGGDKPQAVKILADFLPKAPKVFQLMVARQLAGMAEETQSWNEALAADQRLADAASGATKAYYEAKVSEIKSKMK